MKKYFLFSLILGLNACSTPTQQSSVPMDMQTVAEYQHRISTKQTVDSNNPPNDEPLNQSDRRAKSTQSTILRPIRPVIYPTIGYHHGWRHYRY